MKKLLLAAFLIYLISPITGFAATQPIILGDTVSAFNAVSITDNATTHGNTRGVWIGTTQSIDLYVVQAGTSGTGAWVTFQGATAGTLIPIQARGARITSGAASPNAGDVVFLY